MSASLLPRLAQAVESRQLPMPPVAYAAIAFLLFLLGLAVLWSFRNTANKVADRHRAGGDHH